MHLNGLNTQQGKSNSVVASQGTSRASSPGPDSERIVPAKSDMAHQNHGPESDVPVVQNMTTDVQQHIDEASVNSQHSH